MPKTAEHAFFDFRHNQAAIRHHLRVTLQELESAVGVPAALISESERGGKPLEPGQQSAITKLLKQKLYEKITIARRQPEQEPK